MDCTEAYKEHIMYSFNGFCKVVIRYAAINAWRDRNRRRQREISFECLTEEKFYPLSTSDEALKSPYEQYPVTICGQTIILTNGELAAALLSLPEKKREIIYLYFFRELHTAGNRGIRFPVFLRPFCFSPALQREKIPPQSWRKDCIEPT